MSQLLNDLDPRFRPCAMELIARCAEQNVPLKIVETRRTAAKQAQDLASGASHRVHSLHLDGLAIDVCPYSTFLANGPNKLDWDGKDPVWQKIGAIGKACGCVWGGDWPDFRDMGHFEFKPTQEATQ